MPHAPRAAGSHGPSLFLKRSLPKVRLAEQPQQHCCAAAEPSASRAGAGVPGRVPSEHNRLGSITAHCTIRFWACCHPTPHTSEGPFGWGDTAEMLTRVGRAEGHGARAAAVGTLAAQCAGAASPWLTQPPDMTRCAQGAVMNYGGSYSAHHRGGNPAPLLVPTGMV